MLAIFFEFIKNIIKVFMDKFLIYRTTFDVCLQNLVKVHSRCEKVNLILNLEKCHFMVQGVVLEHIISNGGLRWLG